MSFVLISPEVVSAAAGDLANVGSTISAANKAAAAATTQVLAAGADEVSARIAALFGMYGLEYQAISAQVAAYHQQFVQTLRTGAASYMLAEATNVEQNLLNLINAPTQTLLGRPLIGDGANATTPRTARPIFSCWSRRWCCPGCRSWNTPPCPRTWCCASRTGWSLPAGSTVISPTHCRRATGSPCSTASVTFRCSRLRGASLS